MNDFAKDYIQNLIKLLNYNIGDLDSLPMLYSNQRQEELSMLLKDTVKTLELILKNDQ